MHKHHKGDEQTLIYSSIKAAHAHLDVQLDQFDGHTYDFRLLNEPMPVTAHKSAAQK